MSHSKTIVVVGATGFIGRHTMDVLDSIPGVESRELKAPRMRTSLRNPREIIECATSSVHLESISHLLDGADAVVNVAGLAKPNSTDEDQLFGANCLLPRVIFEAARRTSVRRLIHISSAAVQGRADVLDASDLLHHTTPYGTSKALGEVVLRRCDGVVILRPASVHGHDRQLTRKLVALASSRVACTSTVPRTTPQSLVQNVASAISYLAVTETSPPPVVHMPWEGVDTRRLLELLGGRSPVLLPDALVSAVLSVGRPMTRFLPSLEPGMRRLELLWRGQGVARSWLEDQDWRPVAGEAEWQELGSRVRALVSL